MRLISNILLPLTTFTFGFMLMYTGVLYLNNTNTSPVSKLSHLKMEDIKEESQNFSNKYIEADLQNKTISIFENNKKIKTFDIVTMGKPKSYYETPAGEFTIKTKDKTRYSTLGNVYMPYAMQFFGNFFVHGIPYHSDGTRVSTDYSGGCIRIADADMREIYEFATINTKLIVKNKNINYKINNELDQSVAENSLMVLLSLEVLNQEKLVTYNKKQIKVKDLNYQVAKGDVAAQNIIISMIGKGNYDNYKSERLASLGLSSENLNNRKDLEAFMSYLINNKSFVLGYL